MTFLSPNTEIFYTVSIAVAVVNTVQLLRAMYVKENIDWFKNGKYSVTFLLVNENLISKK